MNLFIISFSVIFIVFFCITTAQLDRESALYNTKVNLTTIRISDSFEIRNVAYYTVGDLAIVDGDIVYGTEALLLTSMVNANIGKRHTVRRNLKAHAQKRAHSIFPNATSNKWPNAKVTYKFYSAEVKTKLQNIVNVAINRWKQGNPFLQFEEVAASSKGVNGQLTINSAPNGCWANVGWASNNPLNMNLQQPTSGDRRGCFEGEATHEFGHVLGLLHEHQRPDRDNHLIYRCENLVDYNSQCSCQASSCCGFGCQFRTDPYSDHKGSYSITSIMQYRADSFAKPGLLTLENKPGSGEVVPTVNPSSPNTADYQRICDIYFDECKFIESMTEI